MPETLGELHCLPLAERTCELDAKRASCRCGGAHPGQMAVAIGAACDFLTPIGHQCNTPVMGPGRYRCGDYWRLGLPLSAIVLLVGVPLIAFFWRV